MKGLPVSRAPRTTNPAKALGLEEFMGQLAEGLKADITVIRAKDTNPNQSLLLSHLQDVEMVWVGGELLYADRAILQTLKPGEWEPLLVHGSQKAICVRDQRDSTEKRDQTLEDIVHSLITSYPNLAPLAL